MSEWLQRSTDIVPTFLTRGENGEKVFEGVASVYYDGTPATEYVTKRSHDGTPIEIERIMPGAFDRALKERQDVIACYDHDSRVMLARSSSGTLELWTSPKGLHYRFAFDESDPDHQRVYAKLKRGDLTGSSFKFWPRQHGCRVERSAGFGPRYMKMTDVLLYDVGPVVQPAYRAASAKARSLWDDAENDQKTAEYLAKIGRLTST